MLKRVWIALVPLLFFLAACGGDGDNGDTLLTGLSGVVIVVLVIVGIWYFARRRG
jgi:predicted permease